jgi:hypothetical protein
MVINDLGDVIDGGTMSGPPFVLFGQAQWMTTTLRNVDMFYDMALGPVLNINTYDSVVGGGLALIRVNRSTFTGYYLTSDTASLIHGTMILTEAIERTDSMSNYHPAPVLNSQMVCGYVDHRPTSDTVFLDFMGAQMEDSTVISIYKALYKK